MSLHHFGEEPALLRADLQSGAWSRLEADLEARLQRLREQNDHGDEETTATRRGRIAEIKELLAFGRVTRAQPSELGR